jgi:hypothetical protein
MLSEASHIILTNPTPHLVGYEELPFQCPDMTLPRVDSELDEKHCGHSQFMPPELR